MSQKVRSTLVLKVSPLSVLKLIIEKYSPQCDRERLTTIILLKRRRQVQFSPEPGGFWARNFEEAEEIFSSRKYGQFEVVIVLPGNVTERSVFNSKTVILL